MTEKTVMETVVTAAAVTAAVVTAAAPEVASAAAVARLSGAKPAGAEKVVVLAFGQISPFHLSVPCVVFGEAHPGMPAFDFAVCAEKPGLLASSAGFAIEVRQGLAAMEGADVIVVPSWQAPEVAASPALCAALRAAADRGASLIGLCLGAYALASAGLLDGRRATTHWAFATDFARRFPAVRVEPDVLYVEDGPCLTSAGTASGIDCCLYWLRRRYGAAVANAVARRLVVAPHRQGGQAQFIERPVPDTAQDVRLSGLLAWVRAHLDQTHTLDSLAARALMSRRTLTRQFRQLTGSPVGQWLLHARLAEAQRLLESTDHAIDTIASLTGLGSPASLRQHFKRAFGVAPGRWRQTFAGKT